MIVFLHVQFETTLELEPGDKTNLDYFNLHLANCSAVFPAPFFTERLTVGTDMSIFATSQFPVIGLLMVCFKCQGSF